MGYCSLIIFWLTFEYIHHNWELSWPWLTLGNVFATHPAWVQWYEYTGTTGGSLWVLLSNVIVYSLFKEYSINGRSKGYFAIMLVWVLLLILPAILFNPKQKKPVFAAPHFLPFRKRVVTGLCLLAAR